MAMKTVMMATGMTMVTPSTLMAMASVILAGLVIRYHVGIQSGRQFPAGYESE